MAYIPVLACAQTELIYTLHGQVVENVLHYEIPLASSPAILAQFALDVRIAWNTHLKVYVPSDASLIAIKVTDLTTQTSPSVVFTTGLPLAGTRGATALPGNVTCAFTKRTALRGRSHRGRIYWPGFREADVVANTVDGALVAAMVTALNNMLTITSDSEAWAMQVLSRYTNNGPRESGVMTPVTNFTSDGVVDSQRRRLPGRGA